MRRSYSGNAKSTTLSGGISAAATSFTVADATGYPIGSNGPFVITIDAGNSAEEKILCTSRTGNTFAVTSRGWDGTTASDHDNAASVRHTISATDLDEANALVSGGGTITASAAGVIPLTVKGAASQTANLAEFQNSAGTVLLEVASNGSINMPNGFVVYADASANIVKQRAWVGAAAADVRPLVVKGAAGQTANLAEFQNSSGTVLVAVKADGALNFAAVPTATTVGAAGAAAALPSNPSGYLLVDVAGNARRIPFYN